MFKYYKMKKGIALLFIVFFAISKSKAQTAPFNVLIKPINISGLGGLQSFAFGQSKGKWLILGGRLDGLHRRQPFAAFDVAGNNNQIVVVDPITKQKWTSPFSSLPTNIQEQLSSTNMEFHQDGDYLYIVGGYGYSPTFGDHTTYSMLTAINVPQVISAVISGGSISSYFRTVSDAKFAITGGQLRKINNTYYLVGGQKFIGRYNPMGPTSGPGFIQEYSNSIHKFNIIDDGITLSVNHLSSIKDTVNLHRRDYNVIQQILPNGAEGITAFSGVFQYTANLPYLNCVDIDSLGYVVNNSFSQYYNHYHCANIPIYSKSKNEMHNLFFGGIAQYYDSLGVLVRDNNVPFTSTIARVTRDGSGIMSEYKLPIEMPSLLGAGSEFIAIETLPAYHNGVFKLDSITKDTTLIGYIYGGISSTGKNIFFTNTGSESSASSQIFEVYLIQGAALSLHHLNEQSVGSLKMQVFPNPNDGNFKIQYNLEKSSNIEITITELSGKIIEQSMYPNQIAGEHIFEKKIRKLSRGGVFMVTVKSQNETATQKVIIEP